MGHSKTQQPMNEKYYIILMVVVKHCTRNQILYPKCKSRRLNGWPSHESFFRLCNNFPNGKRPLRRQQRKDLQAHNVCSQILCEHIHRYSLFSCKEPTWLVKLVLEMILCHTFQTTAKILFVRFSRIAHCYVTLKIQIERPKFACS